MNNKRRKKTRRELYEKQKGLCIICGEPMGHPDIKDRTQKKFRATLEHIIPSADGGSNYIDNLAVSHKICNNKKSSQSSRDFKYMVVFLKMHNIKIEDKSKEELLAEFDNLIEDLENGNKI